MSVAECGPAMAGTTLIGRGAVCARVEQLLLDARTGTECGLGAALGAQGSARPPSSSTPPDRPGATGSSTLSRGSVELPDAGLQLLCASLLDGLGRLQSPRRRVPTRGRWRATTRSSWEAVSRRGLVLSCRVRCPTEGAAECSDDQGRGARHGMHRRGRPGLARGPDRGRLGTREQRMLGSQLGSA